MLAISLGVLSGCLCYSALGLMSDKRSLQLELLCGSSTLLQREIGALFSLASSPLLKAKKTITQKLYT